MLITVLLAVHVNSLPRCLLCSFGFILVHEGSLQSTGASGQQDAAATPFADASVLLLAPVLSYQCMTRLQALQVVSLLRPSSKPC